MEDKSRPPASPELFTAQTAYGALDRARKTLLPIVPGMDSRNLDSKPLRSIIRSMESELRRIRAVAKDLSLREAPQLLLEELDELEADITESLDRASSKVDPE